MNDITTEIVYQSLGNLLTEISNFREIKSSAELAEKVRNALEFHSELKKELQNLTAENRVLKDEMRLASVNGCVEEPLRNFRQFEQMKRRGATIDEVFAETQTQTLDKVNTLKVLRRFFNLSLEEANEVLERANEAVKIAA